MVRHFVTIPAEQQQLDGITCDVCQQRYTDVFDLQEFHFVDLVGGYASVFGDGTRVQADLCQRCLQEKLGPYLRVITEGEEI